MLKIRLSRVGRAHEPVYRLVLTDSKNAAKSGKSLEVLGSYDSRRAEKAEFNAEKINYWVSKGAQMSDTVHNLMLKRGLVSGVKRSVLPKRIIEKARAPKEAPVVENAPSDKIEAKAEPGGIPQGEVPMSDKAEG